MKISGGDKVAEGQKEKMRRKEPDDTDIFSKTLGEAPNKTSSEGL